MLLNVELAAIITGVTLNRFRASLLRRKVTFLTIRDPDFTLPILRHADAVRLNE